LIRKKINEIKSYFELVSINCPIKGTSKNGFGFSVFILPSLSSKMSARREKKKSSKKRVLSRKREQNVRVRKIN